MIHRLASHTVITAGMLTKALIKVRNEAHLDYMLSNERASERAAERMKFCEDLATELGLHLGDPEP